jgi:hypothetical protein
VNTLPVNTPAHSAHTLRIDGTTLSTPALAEPERLLLANYVDRFNARDFDAVRDMLADEVRLELVVAYRRGCRVLYELVLLLTLK